MNKPQKFDRVPPQATDLEESILGAMLIEQEATNDVMFRLKAADFYKPEHQTVFSAISELYNSDSPIDLITVENKLRSMQALDDIGGAGALADLTRSCSSAASADYHCQIIKEKATARKSLATFHNLIQSIYQPDSDIYEVLNQGEKFIYESITGEASSDIATMKTVMNDAFEYLASIQGAEGLVGIPSGLDYDQVTSGWQPGKLYTIAGRTGMGKTAWLLHNLKYAALEGYRPGIISLEMGRNALGTRLMLAEAGVDNQRAMQGKLSENELKRVNDAAIKLMDLGMVIDDTATLTPALLRIKARMMQQIHKIDLLAIDYLQLMRDDGNNQNRNREQEVAEISRTCKLLAKEMDIPVLALAQLSREPDKRRGWQSRPQLSDLRESGALEQDANVVIFLYRPEYYGLDTYPSGPDEGMSTEGVTEVIIAKHREGPTGLKKIYFQKETMSFENLSRQKPAAPPAQPEDNYWWE